MLQYNGPLIMRSLRGISRRNIGRLGRSWTRTLRPYPSTSEAEHQSVASSEDGPATSGITDEEMRQCYPEEMVDAPTQPPSERVKASASSRRPNKDKSMAESRELAF